MKSLNVVNLWKEDGIIWDNYQQQKLDIELESLALLVDIDNVCWLNKITKQSSQYIT